MFRYYFKIIWRNAIRDRRFTLLNVLGLSTGLACALLIWLWVVDERQVDHYNDKDERLYQVMNNLHTEQGISTIRHTPGILANALQKEIPEVEYATAVLPAGWFSSQGIITGGDKKLKADGQYVDSNYFNVFTLQWLEGNKNDLFNGLTSVAISDKLARQLFPSSQNILGKTIEWERGKLGGTFIIKGVFKENPSSATDQFNLLFNYALVLNNRPHLQTWENCDPSTFVLVKKGTNIAQFNSKIKDFVNQKDDRAGYKLFLARFSNRYLYGNYENGVQAGGRIQYVKLFTLIGIFILLIACINFMNLSTAKASRRLKEAGIQKVVGARRHSLVLQYMGESMFMTLLSFLLAVVMVVMLLPAFNDITGKQVSLHITQNLVIAVGCILFVTGLVAGSYPAFYLSGFNPVTVLKGTMKNSVGELWVRKGLVVMQFTLSVVFIAAVLIVYRQLDYIQSKNLGYNRNNVIHFEIPLTEEAQMPAATAFVNELSTIPGVISAASYSHNLTGDHGNISGFEWPGKQEGKDIEFSNLEIGYNFLQTMGIQIKEGRNFSEGPAGLEEIIFNETAIKNMGLKDPIGKTVKYWGYDRKIVGIAADFNFESLYNPVKPCFFRLYPALPNVVVRIQGGTEKQTLEKIQQAYASFAPGLAFDYRFMDEDYQALYTSEKRVSLLSRYFAALAVIISCLGLFGLSAFTAQRRQKEIGIRKVVGASVFSITFLLSKEFLKLVLIALPIALPLVWWSMNNWLDSFAYRITIGPDIFIWTSFSIVLMAIITISFQTIKAAVAKPVKSLRAE